MYSNSKSHTPPSPRGAAPLAQAISFSHLLVASNIANSQISGYRKPGETHLNYLLDKKENWAKFVIIFLGVVGWVERGSVNNHQS